MSKKPDSTTTLRPMGDIMLDMEKLLFEMGVDHDMQWNEILGLVHSWLKVHLPSQQEVYEDGGESPEFYYGPKR